MRVSLDGKNIVFAVMYTTPPYWWRRCKSKCSLRWSMYLSFFSSHASSRKCIVLVSDGTGCWNVMLRESKRCAPCQTRFYVSAGEEIRTLYSVAPSTERQCYARPSAARAAHASQARQRRTLVRPSEISSKCLGRIQSNSPSYLMFFFWASPRNIWRTPS